MITFMILLAPHHIVSNAAGGPLPLAPEHHWRMRRAGAAHSDNAHTRSTRLGNTGLGNTRPNSMTAFPRMMHRRTRSGLRNRKRAASPWMFWGAGMVMTPCCALCLASHPALAHDNLWSSAHMAGQAFNFDAFNLDALNLGAPESRRDLRPARSGASSNQSQHQSMGATHPTAPTQPLQDTDGRRKDRTNLPPAATLAGWDIYAGAHIGLAFDGGGQPLTAALHAGPVITAIRDVGAAQIAVHGAADMPLYAPHATPGISYRLGAATRYTPASDFELSGRIDMARLAVNALAGTAFTGLAFPDGQQLVCGAGRANVQICDRLSACLRATKTLGDTTVAAMILGAQGRWADGPWMADARGRRQTDSGFVGQVRLSHSMSHQLEPYVEASTTRWGTGALSGQPESADRSDVAQTEESWSVLRSSLITKRSGARQGGRFRLIAGAAFPEISLFSGRLYAGIDQPENGPVLPVLGGALSWSPRRTLVFSVQAEQGASGDQPPPGNVTLFADGGALRPGRQTRAALSARWSTSDAIDVSLSTAWTRAQWRLSRAGMPGSAEATASATATLTWAFSPQWLARIDVVALRQTAAWGQPQKRAVTTISLQRTL